MSVIGYLETISVAERNTSTKGSELAAWCLPAAVIVAAVWMRFGVLENADTSWLLTVAENLLSRRHDFIEVNPPGAILTYVPAVWLAGILGIPAEVACNSLVFVLAAVVLGFAAAVLGREFVRQHRLPLLASSAAAILLILPTYSFAEREHLSLILILPWIAVLAARAEGSIPNVWLRLSAGLGCGLCMVIKPHIVIAIAIAVGIQARRMRSWRIIFALENWAVALVVLFYGVILWTKFPDFFTKTLPLVDAVYVPARFGLVALLLSTGSILWASTVVLNFMIERSQRGGTICDILLACSFASYLAVLVQGKGWPYHSYPAIAFALLALAIRLARTHNISTTSDACLRLLQALAAVVIFFHGARWFNLQTVDYDRHAVAREIERLAPRPTIAIISGDLSFGFPLTRLAHGVWAQRTCSLWIVEDIAIQKAEGADPEKIAALAPYEALGRDMLIEDIRRNRPTILLVDDRSQFNWLGWPNGNWLGWAQADPRFARTLLAYKFVQRIGDAQIWQRR